MELVTLIGSRIIFIQLQLIFYTVRPNKKETRFISEISSLPRKI